MAQWQIDDITITQLIEIPAGSGALGVMPARDQGL